MKKVVLGLMLVMVPVLSGCSFPKIGGGSSVGPTVSFARSTDGGTTFESKSKIDEKTNFATAEVLSMASSRQDTRQIFVGTKEAGIFASDNSGDSWRKIQYPPTKVYGLVADMNDVRRLFATGEWEGRGKIYRTADAGENWDEVYTEPENGTVITALAQNPFNPQVLYAGTSAGMVIRTNDGGATWKNIMLTQKMNGHVVWDIEFDTKKDNTLYFLVDGSGVFLSDGEKIVSEPSASNLSFGSTSLGSGGAISLALDPNRSGVVYAGSSKGVLRSEDYGKNWGALNVIESSKKFPIRAIAINPKNSDEIVYVSALTLYKSINGGAHWSTHQIESDKTASFIQYDSYDPNIIYIGFKK